MKNNYRIRLETKADHRAAENLTREAFWNVYRSGCTEHSCTSFVTGKISFRNWISSWRKTEKSSVM